MIPRLFMAVCSCMLGVANAAQLYLLPSVEVGAHFSGDITPDGSVFVSGGTQAVRWTASGGIDYFLPSLPSVTHSSASGISADGSTIAGNFLRTDGTRASYTWTEQGGMKMLDQRPGEFSVASGISGDGATVIGSDRENASTAIYWTSDGSIHALPEYLSDKSNAYGISYDGSVIVGAARDSNGSNAVSWLNGVGPSSLGTLPGGPYNNDANDVSPDGAYIVGLATNAAGEFEAFRWTQESKMVGLGQLCTESYCDLTVAYGVSADGSTVVGRGHADGSHDHAFIWTEDGGMQDLSDYLLAIGVDTQGVELTTAFGISDDGSTIFGEYIGGTYIANLTVIPVPPALYLFGSGLLGLVGMARRKTA